MKLFIFACALIACVAGAAVEKKCTDAQWTEYVAWRTKYNKTLNDDATEAARCLCYFNNLKHIKKNNADPTTHDSGINHLTGLCKKDYKKRLGYKIPKTRAPEASRQKRAAVTLPDSLDYRTTSPPLVTAVKSQGLCGSCYSFASIGVIEGQWIKANPKSTINLAEQQIVDCSGSYRNSGCNGGNMKNSWTYLKNGSNGSGTTASYPYFSGTTNAPGTCKTSTATVGTKIASTGVSVAQNELAFMTALYTIGPIAVAIDASQDSFGSYEGGIYVEPQCTTNLDHAVLLIGYTPDSWILKNSWSTTWGENGFFQLPRGDGNNCGMLLYGSYTLI